MEILPTVVETALVQGGLYGLVGLAFLAIYSASRLLNFSQGEFLMLGGVGAWLTVMVWQLPPLLAFAVVVIGVAIVGVIIQQLASPLVRRGTPMFTIAILTLGCSQIISGSVGPATTYSYLHVGSYFGSAIITVGGIAVLPEQAVLLGATIAICAGYWAFLHFTWLGRGLRAIGVDREMAGLVGVRSEVMTITAFIVSAAMAATAGFIVAPLTPPQAQSGILFLVKGFAAAVIGGLGNPFAALLGGFLLAFIEAIIAAYVNTTFSSYGVFLIMILVILIRPEGIFATEDASVI